MMFRSSSFHTIDPKGRIIIPARFREVMRSSDCDGLMVSNMDNCLFAYTYVQWYEIEKKVLAAKSGHMRQFKRFFLGNACECLCDKQDRILIPPSLRAYAGLDKEIVLVGVNDHFEIWSRERWDAENTQVAEALKEPEFREEIASLGL
jgi:MraZ protein